MFERLPALQVRLSPVLLTLRDDGGGEGSSRKKKENTDVCTGDNRVWGQDPGLKTWGQGDTQGTVSLTGPAQVRPCYRVRSRRGVGEVLLNWV